MTRSARRPRCNPFSMTRPVIRKAAGSPKGHPAARIDRHPLACRGCGSGRRSISPRPTSMFRALRCWCGAARAVGVARSGWIAGRGPAGCVAGVAATVARGCAVMRGPRRDRRAALGRVLSPQTTRAYRGPRRRAPAVCAPSTASRPRGRDGARGRTACRDPAPTPLSPTRRAAHAARLAFRAEEGRDGSRPRACPVYVESGTPGSAAAVRVRGVAPIR